MLKFLSSIKVCIGFRVNFYVAKVTKYVCVTDSHPVKTIKVMMPKVEAIFNQLYRMLLTYQCTYVGHMHSCPLGMQ